MNVVKGAYCICIEEIMKDRWDWVAKYNGSQATLRCMCNCAYLQQ